MRIQDHDLTLPPIWATLDRVRRTLGVGSKHMAELMRMTLPEYQKYSLQRKEPPAGSLLYLCRNLYISFDLFMMNSFCYRTMARHYYGDKSIIPEKYTIAGMSRRRVLTSLLDFVEVASDYQRRLELMRHLQINESALTDAEGTVNLRCTMEAVDWLHHYSQNDELLEQLGRGMMLNPQNQPIFSQLKSCRTVYELYDALMSESGLFYTQFEKNFLWKIHRVIRGEKILIRGTVNEEVRLAVGDSLVQSRGGALGRAGMVSAATEIMGWDRVPVKVTNGAAGDRHIYEVEVDISKLIKTSPRQRLTLVH